LPQPSKPAISNGFFKAGNLSIWIPGSIMI
jgi:hypothetical protein